MLVPDASFGAYFLKTDAYMGLSIANMFQTRINIGSRSYDYRMFRHYFLLGGKRFSPTNTFSYEPSFMLKATEKMIFQGDLQMRFYYQNDYYFGLSYRTGSSVGFLLGAKYERLFIGYAFDYGLTSLQQFSKGAHEINLALKLGDNTKRYKWLIRY